MVNRIFLKTAVMGLALALSVSGMAWATPSTQIWIPSTDTQTTRTVHLGVDNYTTFFTKAEDGGRMFPTTFGITAGVFDSSLLGMELGVDIREQSDDPTYFNGKFQVKENSLSPYMPAIAVGGYDFGSKSEVTNYNIFYGLVAKTLPVIGRLSAGYYTGNDVLLKDSSGDTANHGVLLSWDRTIAELDDRLWLAVDYQGGQNSYGALSFGFAWRFSPHISVILGYDIFNDEKVAGKNTVTTQFDIDLF